MTEEFEHFQVRLALSGGAKGDGRIQIAPAESDLVFQAMFDFAKGRVQRCLEGRPAILLKRLLRDEKGDDFSFGHLDIREIGDRLGVNKTEMKLVILYRQSERVAHELDVALNCL